MRGYLHVCFNNYLLNVIINLFLIRIGILAQVHYTLFICLIITIVFKDAILVLSST